MKNVIILVLFVSTVVAGYVAASSSLRLSREGMEGKLEKLIRGDLTIPINATGAVRPAHRVEIKSEASGEVIEIAKHGGDRVVVGDLLIRLQEDDERRNVNRARLDLKVAAANLEDARIQLQLAETADLNNAHARVDQLEQTVRLAKFRLDKILKLAEDQRSVEEMLERETTYRSQLAQRQQAQAAYDRAQQAIPSAKQRLLQAEARWETSKNNLGDAEKRLAKTKIIAPGDGVVADIRTRIGEVIQGGKTSLTGGTVLAVILDMNKIIVRAEVDEADIGRVLEIAPAWAQPGHDSSLQLPDDVRGAAESMEHLPVITVESFRDEKFQGIIERIFPEPKVLSGVVTYLVDVVVVSENRSKLLSGMRAEVTFTADHVENALLCPNEAVRKGPRGTLGVYVPKKNAPPSERATEFVPFTLGLDNGNYTQVVSGLEEDAVVYTKLPEKKEPEKKKKRRRR